LTANNQAANKRFLSESGSELFCAVIEDENRNSKPKAIEVNNFCIGLL